MKKRLLTRIALILTVVLVNISCDQVSKKAVRKHVMSHEEIHLIDDNFILTNVENTGAALSLGSDLSPTVKTIVLIVLPIIALIAFLGMVVVNQQLKTGFLVSICFIVGGGIGNIIDRMAYGSVTDFLHIDLGLVRTGVFNMADVSITLGGIAVLVLYWQESRKKKGISSIEEIEEK